MIKEEKFKLVDELSEKLKNCQYFYIADPSSMTVAEVNKLRRAFYDKGLEYVVVKNSLIKKALSRLDADTTAMEMALKGTSGIIFSPQAANAPAKVIQDFRKGPMKKPTLKAAYIDSDIFVGDENLQVLCDLKSKNELIADVVALLQSPAKNVVSALQSGKNTLGGLLKTLSDR